MKKIGRNDPCPCGSGKKFKHCCQPKDHVRTANARVNKAFIPGALQQAIENHQTGDLPQAQALYQQILQAEPKHPDALHLLGLIYHQQGKSAVAVDLIQQAIRAKPSEVIYYFNLGNMHQDIGQLDEAVAYYRQALLRAPDSVDTLSGLGTALRAQDLLDEAIASYRQALSIQADIPEVHFNLANALLNQGRLDEAIATYRQALLLKPEDAVTYSNLLFTMQNLSTCSAEEVFREHQRYADRFETPLKSSWHRHSNNRDPARRIKVGYVSGDFRQHPVAYFIEPILSSHDKSRVEVYGYYNNTKHDRHTEQIVACTDHWMFCHDLSDAQLVECIRADGIDILIDLSGHTALNRLRVFAQKPAPLQATWFGYSGSTGLTAMDYRITDAFMDPPGLTECFHSETLIRLPDGGVAYRPEPDCPAVNELPALRSGELIFASLNTLSKINPAVVNLWARILHALPRARLMLGNVTNREIARRLLGMFSQTGIGPGQLILQPQMTMADYLALHQQIDIGLDPFPYNGGTTTMHSLWMGVPVITLAGDHAISRFGVSLMSRVGLTEFICHGEEEYMQCALRLAHDLPGLSRIRQSLRERMTRTEWDPVNITRQLEAAYRDMWRKWCAQ